MTTETERPMPTRQHTINRWSATMYLDPFHSLIQGRSGRLTEFLQRNLGMDNAGRNRHILFFSDHKYGAYLWRRVLGIIGIADKQTLVDQVHCVVSIGGKAAGQGIPLIPGGVVEDRSTRCVYSLRLVRGT